MTPAIGRPTERHGSGRDVILWGAGGHAVVLAELLAYGGRRVLALFDNSPSARSPLPGVPIYHGTAGFESWLRDRDASHELEALVAIGGGRGQDRLDIASLFEERGIRMATAIHPRAFVASGVPLGKGSQVLAMSAVAANVILGDACIVNTGASVDHESLLAEGVHVGPGATLAGCVTVGPCSFIGANATILPRIRIGARSIVGAGSVVVRDVPEGVIVVGNPARVLRKV